MPDHLAAWEPWKKPTDFELRDFELRLAVHLTTSVNRSLHTRHTTWPCATSSPYQSQRSKELFGSPTSL